MQKMGTIASSTPWNEPFPVHFDPSQRSCVILSSLHHATRKHTSVGQLKHTLLSPAGDIEHRPSCLQFLSPSGMSSTPGVPTMNQHDCHSYEQLHHPHTKFLRLRHRATSEKSRQEKRSPCYGHYCPQTSLLLSRIHASVFYATIHTSSLHGLQFHAMRQKHPCRRDRLLPSPSWKKQQ